jgi:hypothetical protein
MTFNCDDLQGQTSKIITLHLYAIDQSENKAYCQVQLRISDNGINACSDDPYTMATIAGEIKNEAGDMVENVLIDLNTSTTSITKADGQYAFKENIMDETYEIRAERTDNVINGVTALDLVLIQRHILGLRVIDSPYKLIAADINDDEFVSGLDQVHLRRLLLGLDKEFASNKSWRFVSAHQVFTQEAQPWPYEEHIVIPALKNDMMNEDFIAVKIGDISEDAIPNSTIGEIRNHGQLQIYTENKTITAGEETDVAFIIPADQELTALQFTLELEGLSFVELQQGRLDIDEQYMALLDEHTLTVVWNDDFIADSHNYDDPNVLFTITFRAEQNTRLEDAIHLSSKVTEALAYDVNYEELAVQITNEPLVQLEKSIVLEQNKPNPFIDQTAISFYLPYSDDISFTVFDMTGKVVYRKSGYYKQGEHNIYLQKREMGQAKGVLHYLLETSTEYLSKRMIIID